MFNIAYPLIILILICIEIKIRILIGIVSFPLLWRTLLNLTFKCQRFLFQCIIIFLIILDISLVMWMSFCKRWCFIRNEYVGAVSTFFLFILYNWYLILSCGCPCSHIWDLVIVPWFFWMILKSYHCFIYSTIIIKTFRFCILNCFLFLKLPLFFIIRDFEGHSFWLTFIFLNSII